MTFFPVSKTFSRGLALLRSPQIPRLERLVRTSASPWLSGPRNLSRVRAGSTSHQHIPSTPETLPSETAPLGHEAGSGGEQGTVSSHFCNPNIEARSQRLANSRGKWWRKPADGAPEGDDAVMTVGESPARCLGGGNCRADGDLERPGHLVAIPALGTRAVVAFHVGNWD